MGRKKKFTDHELVVLLGQTRGNYHACAIKLDVARSTINERVEKSAELTKLVHDLREGRLDIAETALDAAVLRGEPYAICFTLKTQGRSRGYIERQAVDLTSQNQHTVKTETVADLTGLTSEQVHALDEILSKIIPDASKVA